ETPRGAERRRGERRAPAIEEIADPARLRLQHHDAQTREAFKNPELEERGERLLHALAGKEVQVPDRPAELVESMVHVEGDRLEGGVDRKRHVEILGGGEHRVVARIAVRYPRDGERADERAATAVSYRALELARSLAGAAERQLARPDHTPP